MKKGRKQESLSLLNVSKRFTDNWEMGSRFLQEKVNHFPGYL
jgi:hypothetical protein